MRALAMFLAGLTLLLLLSLPLQPQASTPQPLILPLTCNGSDCPLLQGPPQTAGMRSGFVRLKPGAAVGWHSTATNEEQLVVLHGQGDALIEGQPARPFNSPIAVYFPPATRHNVTNTGSSDLEYVYVVAPHIKDGPSSNN
jgi:quercetin dioxygenase-like cupin family protein